jgi:ADP-ribose pyrophosphatase
MTGEKKVFDGEYVQVTLEERGVHTYERVYLRPGITVIPVTADKRIRCIKEKNWNTGVTRTKLVSGYIDPGEDPLACAKRELSEEIGVTAESWTLYLCAESEEGTVQKKQYYFVAKNLVAGQAHPNSDEQIEGFVDLSFHEVYEAVRAGAFGTGSTAFVLLKLTSVERQ